MSRPELSADMSDLIINNTETVKIVEEFVGKIDKTKAYTRKELIQTLTEIYKEAKKKEVIQKMTDEEPRKRGRPIKIRLDKNGNVKEKKEKTKPTAYNLFVSNRIKELKKNQDTDARELLKMASAEWRNLSLEEKSYWKTITGTNK